MIQYTRLHAAGREPYRHTRVSAIPIPSREDAKSADASLRGILSSYVETVVDAFHKNINRRKERDKDKNLLSEDFFDIKETINYSNRTLRDKINKKK